MLLYRKYSPPPSHLSSSHQDEVSGHRIKSARSNPQHQHKKPDMAMFMPIITLVGRACKDVRRQGHLWGLLATSLATG